MTEKKKTRWEKAGEVHATFEQRRVSDVVGSGEISFHVDCERMKLADVVLLGDIRIIDAIIVEGFETVYGAHDLALVAFTNSDDGEVLTTATSGMVTVKKIRKLIEGNAFPITGAFINTGKYYDLI